MKDGTSNFSTDDDGAEVCTPNVDCFPTKQNCNDTLTCSDLVKLKDDLMEGGYNIVCRHEKTFWQQYTGEVKNCHLSGDCMDPHVKATQRQLQPWGWESANEFATSFREMGIPVGKTYSSPFTRCAEHADLFSDEANEERLELLYMGGWKEVLMLYNITEVIKPNALKWQAYNIRNFVGKKPEPGTNNIMVTHGFNIKLGFGLAVDEGYCMVLKPEDSEPSLAESIGSLTVANQIFEYESDSFPVDAIARMSPESAPLMQTCDNVRADARDSDDEDLFALLDANHDMMITKEEFTSALGPLPNSEDAFDFIQSVFAQPEVLGKPNDNENELSSIHLGQFYHINWGWREFLTSGGDISYPWRFVLENTIGPMGLSSPDERVAAFKEANVVLSNLIIAILDQEKYPNKAAMEKTLIDCDTSTESESQSQYLASIVDKILLAQTSGSSYIPVGAGDGGAAASFDESIFGTPLAYPSGWKPSSDIYNSKPLKVAICLAVQDEVGREITDPETEKPTKKSSKKSPKNNKKNHKI
ncbi:unnamed protein product [Pseudo-nitzschia multistriata]|uniref:EF-hand domain-containing protein n=1 Tax=Pseudo-nitzschia multistriata TaxID=183589 RepID=A0A448Z3U3_9STRA|nr:unnamed protein product [Pseudo-nitzschia multistriata]